MMQFSTNEWPGLLLWRRKTKNQSKRQEKNMFLSGHLPKLLGPLFLDWPPSGSTYRLLRDLAHSCPIQHVTLQLRASALLLQVGLPVVYPVNKWECSSPTLLLSPRNTWKPVWVGAESQSPFSVFQDQLVAFWKWNCFENCCCRNKRRKAACCPAWKPSVNQMINWDNLGNEAVNPKLFVVLWSF